MSTELIGKLEVEIRTKKVLFAEENSPIKGRGSGVSAKEGSKVRK